MEEEIQAAYRGVQVLSSAGVRAVELCYPHKGNYLTKSVIETLIKKIEDFEHNWIANAIFLGSRSLFYFSNGVHDSDFLHDAEGQSLDKAIQVCASRIHDFPNQLIALYGGFISGTPFGMLLGCHYRMGTPSLILSLTEFTRGQLPLGALALQFARYTTNSPVVLKYLALSGTTLNSVDLYELGVLSQLTGHKPHVGMQYGDTVLKNDTKAIQGAHGEPEYLHDMMDDIDINVEAEDVRKHEAWAHFLTVPVADMPEDPVDPCHIKLIFDQVETCFGAGVSVEESLRLLVERSGEKWAQQALSHAVTCDPLALHCWFRLVDEAERRAQVYKDMALSDVNKSEELNAFFKRNHADMLAIEVRLNELLRQQQKTGLWKNKNRVEKEKFDLSYYEDDPPEVIDLLEKKSLKQIAEEKQREAEAKALKEKQLAADTEAFLVHLRAVDRAQVEGAFLPPAVVPEDQIEEAAVV